jgi:hypothetical protein
MQFVEKIQVITIKNFTTMAVTKYVITNNLSVLYNTREEAEVAKLETAFARGAFKRLYTVAPFIVK